MAQRGSSVGVTIDAHFDNHDSITITETSPLS